MEVANIRTQLDSFQEHLAATKDFVRHFTNIDYEIKWIKATLADIDSDLKYLFNTVHHNKDEEEKENRFGSRRRYKGGGGGAGSRGGNTADQQEDNTTTTGTEN